MKIYVGHSSSINYKERVYRPLRNSRLDEAYDLVLPHEDSDKPFNSKDFLKNECDVFVAEVSKASTGLGIELGWADLYDVPIVCIYREDSNPSSSLTEVADNLQEYKNSQDLVNVVEKTVKQHYNL